MFCVEIISLYSCIQQILEPSTQSCTKSHARYPGYTHLSARCTDSTRLTPNNLPWITQPVRKHMKRRDRLLKKAKRWNIPPAWKAYRIQRNATTNAIRKAHDNYVHDIIGDLTYSTPQDNSSSIKRFFSYVKATRKEKNDTPTLHRDGTPVTSDKEKADVINQQDSFTNKGYWTSPTLDHLLSILAVRSPSQSQASSSFSEVCNPIKPQPWLHPTKDPEELVQELGPILKILFQQLYNTGVTPQDWRDANVAPIYKKGNRHQPENYQPVSLTAVLNKIYEHVLCSTIMSHLEKMWNPDRRSARIQKWTIDRDSAFGILTRFVGVPALRKPDECDIPGLLEGVRLRASPATTREAPILRNKW